MEREVPRSLYRALVRAARQVDDRPVAKALITRPPGSVYDFAAEKWTPCAPRPAATSDPPATATAASRRRMTDALVERVTEEFLQGAVYYRPSVGMLRQVRAEFRQEQPRGPMEYQARLDAAFAVLRRLSEASAIADQTAVTTKRPRARSIKTSGPEVVPASPFGLQLERRGEPDTTAAQPHQTPFAGLQQGSVLVAHPLLDGCFSRSIILITSYHKDHGAQGIILNSRRIGFISCSRLLGISRTSTLQPKVGLPDLPVHDGGPVRNGYTILAGGLRSLSIVNVIHPYGHLPGAVEIADGAYLNFDEDSAAAELSSGKIDVNELLVYGDSAGWGRGQLEGELAQNAWYLTKATSLRGLIGTIAKRQDRRDSSSDLTAVPRVTDFQEALDRAFGSGRADKPQADTGSERDRPRSLAKITAADPAWISVSSPRGGAGANVATGNSQFVQDLLDVAAGQGDNPREVLSVTNAGEGSEDEDEGEEDEEGSDAEDGISEEGSWQDVFHYVDGQHQSAPTSDNSASRNDGRSWGEVVRSFGGEYTDLASVPSRGD